MASRETEDGILAFTNSTTLSFNFTATSFSLHQRRYISEMCTSKLLKSPSCEHWWAEILKPCAEDRNFGNCSSFENGKVRNLKSNPWQKAEEKSCPRCDKKDDYDGDKIRMVKGIQQGYKWGTGPSKSDFGCDLLTPHSAFVRTKRSHEVPQMVCCCVMM